MPARFLHLSNVVTYAAILAGLLVVVAAKEGQGTAVAGILIGVACLADAFDGAFARLFRRDALQKRFGAQLDSLADALVFGAVPVVADLFFLSFASPGEQVLWVASALLYLVAVVTRLGCFNLEQAGEDRFVGLPTTLAGLFWCAYWLAPPRPLASSLLLVGLAVAMLAPVRIPRMGRVGLLILLLCVVALVSGHAVLAWQSGVQRGSD